MIIVHSTYSNASFAAIRSRRNAIRSSLALRSSAVGRHSQITSPSHILNKYLRFMCKVNFNLN